MQGWFYILACTLQLVWLRQTVEQGLSEAPRPPITGLWLESKALTLLSLCPPWPSLRARWEDVLTWGGVASGLSLLWTPALHPVHLSGWPSGLPAGDLPHGVPLPSPRESGGKVLQDLPRYREMLGAGRALARVNSSDVDGAWAPSHRMQGF